ncbi:flagellar assembly protein FliW [Acidimicrobiaceae bacterium USS-CC1]|uniref:Flagellar assembly factor FliW n=1 Tax=Acidiferrimicrobium australe TaxID=2664430 RepID=A0ABW9QSF0_9ACTN|nr:flagellar assembly protein FliW [Acidiferrimicrobium australe]
MTDVLMPVLSTIRFPQGIPGFGTLREARCEPWGGDESPFVLLSAEEPSVRFVVAPPHIFFPDYRPEVPADIRADLALADGEGLLLVILTLGSGPADTTANLLGPLVVNPATGRARQAVLNAAEWSPRTPLLAT